MRSGVRIGAASRIARRFFAGGLYFCAPHEPRFLQQVDEAIEDVAKSPETRYCPIRNHPIDSD